MMKELPEEPNQENRHKRRVPLWAWLLGLVLLVLAVWLAWPAAKPEVAAPAPEVPAAPQPKAPVFTQGPAMTPLPVQSVPTVTVDAEGVVKVNGVVPEAQADGKPPLGLERAISMREWTDDKGRYRQLWADDALGIVAETAQGPGSEAPRILALEMGTQGARVAPGLRFHGVVEVLGQRVDLANPRQHGAADLERLQQPGVTQWQWARGRLMLDFAVKDTKVSVLLNNSADGVTGVMLAPGAGGEQ